jgi:Flp pilus assembly protein TadD
MKYNQKIQIQQLKKQKIQQTAVNNPLKTSEKSKFEVPDYKPFNKWLIYGIIFTFTFILYGNTIPNDFALDDGIVITKNEFTKKGVKGIIDILSYDTMAGEHGKKVDFVAGGRYRPLSVVMFALFWDVWGENSHLYHLLNVILYAFTGILIFMVFNKLLIHHSLRPYIPKWYFAIPFLTTLMFIGHPIHTEIVANIKGADEILTLIGSLAGIWFTLKYLDKYKIIYLILSFLCFFAGLMSKENSITFLAVVPLAVYFFTDKPAKKVLIAMIPLLLATAAFLYLRYITIGFSSKGTEHELMNNPFVDANFSQRYGTVFYTFWFYIKLLFFPHPITWDYYPYYIPLVSLDEPRSVLPMLFYIALGIYALIGLRKKNNIIAFGLWVYFATLSIVSNLLFSIGAFMSERFMYLPSLGFCLIITFLLVRKLPEYLLSKYNLSPNKIRNIVIACFSVIFILYGLKTITRNFNWKDNYTLFTHDVKISKGSAKGLTTAGEQLVIKGMAEKDSVQRSNYFTLAIEYLEEAMRIHPRYIAARLDLGIAYEKKNKNYQKAVDLYISTIELKPDYDKAYNNINVIFYNIKTPESVDFQLNTYERLYKINPNRADVNYVLGSLSGAYKHDLKRSIFHLERAIQLDKNLVDAYADLGVAYGVSGDYKKACEILEIAYKLRPEYLLVINNLVASYKMVGNKERSDFFDQKRKEVEAIYAQKRREAEQKQKQ